MVRQFCLSFCAKKSIVLSSLFFGEDVALSKHFLLEDSFDIVIVTVVNSDKLTCVNGNKLRRKILCGDVYSILAIIYTPLRRAKQSLRRPEQPLRRAKQSFRRSEQPLRRAKQSFRRSKRWAKNSQVLPGTLNQKLKRTCGGGSPWYEQ